MKPTKWSQSIFTKSIWILLWCGLTTDWLTDWLALANSNVSTPPSEQQSNSSKLETDKADCSDSLERITPIGLELSSQLDWTARSKTDRSLRQTGRQTDRQTDTSHPGQVIYCLIRNKIWKPASQAFQQTETQHNSKVLILVTVNCSSSFPLTL